MCKARAEEFRTQSKYSEAARHYTLAAYENLGEFDYSDPEQITTGTFIGLGLYCLEQAAVLSHVAGNERRCRNRAKQGILIAKDFRDDVFTDSALIGIANEWIGDFRVIAEMVGVEPAYSAALRAYESVDDSFGWSNETIFEWGIETFLEVSAAVERPVPLDIQKAMHSSLEVRLEQKQENFQKHILILYEKGEYPEMNDIPHMEDSLGSDGDE